MTKEIDEEKVRMLAEATGRSESDIRADLEDDGVLNESNRENDLVSQLREAAELITTVQQVSKKVADNTVLNGGENKTNVEVETTLEGDIVDRAIDSVERKVEKIKKIAIMLSPLFLIIGGGGAYGLFSVDDADDDDFDVDYYIDEYYDYCEMNWEWSDSTWIDDETQAITVSQEFYDTNYCATDMDGYFEITLVDENDIESNHDIQSGVFQQYFMVKQEFSNLAEHVYTIEVVFYSYDGSHWGSPYNPVLKVKYDEPEPEPEPECNGTALFYEVGYTWSNYTNDTANITVSWDADWSCDESQPVEVDFYVINSTQDMVVGQVLTQTLEGDTRNTVSHSAGDLLKNETYTVYLAIWVDNDGWTLHDEWQVETQYP